jgi:hypothetical protein
MQIEHSILPVFPGCQTTFHSLIRFGCVLFASFQVSSGLFLPFPERAFSFAL